MKENREKDYELEANSEEYSSIWTKEEQEFSETKSSLETFTDSSINNSNTSDDINVWAVLGRFFIGVMMLLISFINFHPYVLDGKIQVINATNNEFGDYINLLVGISIFAIFNAIAILIITKNLTFVILINNLFMLAAFVCVFIPGFQLNSIIGFIISLIILYIDTKQVPYKEFISIFFVVLGVLVLPSEYALTWNLFLTIFIVNLIYILLYKLNNNELL